MFERPNDANKIITSFMNDQNCSFSERNNECLIGKPTSQMLGRWQLLIKGIRNYSKALNLSGQVCIMFRDVSGVDAGVGVNQITL